MTLINHRTVVYIRTSKAVKKEIELWCDETFGKRGHWKEPMNTKPWYVRRSIGLDEYEFSFTTGANASMFILRWK